MEKRRLVLVTGCSSGFGFLIALRLARSGWRVYATVRDLSKAQDLSAAALAESLDLVVLTLDVTKAESIRAAAEEIGRREGRLDALVNNAGIGMGGFCWDLGIDEYREQFETNFFGVLAVTKSFLPLLRLGVDPRIVMISSMSGLTTTPGMSAYVASKWALEGFSESLAQELDFVGIRVSIVEPGPYPTKLLTTNTRFAKKGLDPSSPFYDRSVRLKESFDKRTDGLRKSPEEVARLVARLLERKHPPFRNPVGPQSRSRLLLRSVLSFEAMKKLLRRLIWGKSARKR